MLPISVYAVACASAQSFSYPFLFLTVCKHSLLMLNFNFKVRYRPSWVIHSFIHRASCEKLFEIISASDLAICLIIWVIWIYPGFLLASCRREIEMCAHISLCFCAAPISFAFFQARHFRIAPISVGKRTRHYVPWLVQLSYTKLLLFNLFLATTTNISS